MKKTVETLSDMGLIFRTLEPIDLKRLGTRKKMTLYLGVDPGDYYAVVISIEKKSRILRKEAGELMEFHPRLEELIDAKITKKYLLVAAPLCSKAKGLLEEKGWVVEVEG